MDYRHVHSERTERPGCLEPEEPSPDHDRLSAFRGEPPYPAAVLEVPECNDAVQVRSPGIGDNGKGARGEHEPVISRLMAALCPDNTLFPVDGNDLFRGADLYGALPVPFRAVHGKVRGRLLSGKHA